MSRTKESSAQEMIGQILPASRGDRSMTQIVRCHPLIPGEHFAAAEAGRLKQVVQKKDLLAVIGAYRLGTKAGLQVAYLMSVAVWDPEPKKEPIPIRMPMPHGAHRARL